jgi:hypothetical protein
MISNSATPYPRGVAHPFTLNDLRVQNTVAEQPPSTSGLTLAGVALAVVLAIGAFLWMDPLHLFTPTETSPPTPGVVPSGEAAQPTERQEIVAPQTSVPATKSVEAPIAPAPVVQAPQVPAPVARPRASIKPDSRGNPMDKTNTTVARADHNERTAPPALLTEPEEKATSPVPPSKPEEKTDAPIFPKLGDDTKNAPKPAATNDQAPVTE